MTVMYYSLQVYIKRCTAGDDVALSCGVHQPMYQLRTYPVVAVATQTVYDNLFCMVIFGCAEKGSKKM